jgi:hypothetical protein
MKRLGQVRNDIRKKHYSIGAGQETGAASGGHVEGRGPAGIATSFA